MTNKKRIVKYVNYEPVYLDVELTVHPSKVNYVNGCVAGLPCERCKWNTMDKRCPSGIYCKKPTYEACP